jgi:dCMP deaminase
MQDFCCGGRRTSEASSILGVCPPGWYGVKYSTSDYLIMAYKQAAKSPDPSNQNGAIIVLEEEIVTTGYNTFPDGIEINQDRLNDRDTKLKYIEHAERWAVLKACTLEKSLYGATMYCPWAACSDCARAIIISGCKKLVVHRPRMDTTPERWKASVDEALKMLNEAGVVVEYFDDPIPEAPEIMVNGSKWQP